MILVDEFAIAIGAFDPAVFARDLQPDARVAQSAFAAVTGDAVCVNDFGFRCFGGHGHLLSLTFVPCLCDMSAGAASGLGVAVDSELVTVVSCRAHVDVLNPIVGENFANPWRDFIFHDDGSRSVHDAVVV